MTAREMIARRNQLATADMLARARRREQIGQLSTMRFVRAGAGRRIHVEGCPSIAHSTRLIPADRPDRPGDLCAACWSLVE